MKLQTKLIIAFASIVIVIALLQSFFFQQRVGNDFEDYISQNESERIILWQELLTEYYIYYGSFEGVQEFLDNSKVDIRSKKGYMGGRNYLLPMIDNLDIIVVNSEGIVVGDSNQLFIGQKSEDIVGIREDIIIDGEKVGELIAFREKTMGLQTIEDQFIDSMNVSIIFSAIISVFIAVIFGIFISSKITKPLEKLMIGIRHLSKGDTSYRVQVDTKDEFNHLATAFNDMSMQIKQNEDVRRTLVADVAHELRTPLAILSGRLESIQEGALEPTQEVIIQLNDEVYRLTRLVNDLQQLSLAEAGKLPLNKSDVNINEMVQRVIYHFSWLAEEKNIKISFQTTIDFDINIDSDRITQVIINILGNSLRHTPENGKIIIELFKNSSDNDVIIKLKDSGPGIDKEHLPYIFDRFYRTDASRSRDQGGTGLGLSIAKGFVEAHGGNISVESENGNGSTFIIAIPNER